MTSSERPGRRVLIIGCGIAGPVLATFLQRAVMEPIVYEAATEPRDDEGAFLQLASMGVDVLETLGITGDEIEAAGGFPGSGIVFYNSGGDAIAELDGTEAHGARSYVIKRGRLAGFRIRGSHSPVRVSGRCI